MDKAQFSEIMTTIESLYPGRFDISKVAKAWWISLKDYDFARTMHALHRYVEHGTFPPTISDLVQEQASRRRAESNQTVQSVLDHANKSEEQIRKEYEEKFNQSGFKMIWKEPEKTEMPGWLKKREAERRGRSE